MAAKNSDQGTSRGAAVGDSSTQSPASARERTLRTIQEKGNEIAQTLENSAAAIGIEVAQAAATIEEKGNVTVNTVAKLSGRTARYVRTHDADAMVNDLRRVVRRHPTWAMGASLLAGLAVGRSVFRR